MIGHAGFINDVRVQPDGIVLDREVQNIFANGEIRHVLGGVCRASSDGRDLIEIRLVP